MTYTIYTSEYFYRKLSYSALSPPRLLSILFNPASNSVKNDLNVA